MRVVYPVVRRSRDKENSRSQAPPLPSHNESISLLDRIHRDHRNPAFEKVYGFTPEEVLGKTPRIIKSGIIPDEQYKNIWGTLLSGGTITGEIANKTKDGRIVPIAGTNSPILDETGKIIGFLAVHPDITERKRSDELVQRRYTYLAASAEIGRLVTSTLDINTIFTRTVNLVSDRLGFYFAAIYQVEEEGFHAIMREGTGGAGESMKIQKDRVAVGSQTMVGQAAESGEIKLANDTQNEPLYQPDPSKTARWMRSNVPGVHIPDAVIERMEKSKNEKAEGKQLAIDLILEIKEIEGVHGLHVMAYRQEEFVNDIIHASGVMKNRQPRRAPRPAAPVSVLA